MEITIAIIAGILIIYLIARTFSRSSQPGVFQPDEKTAGENYHSEPIISYSLLVADVKTNRLTEVRPPEDYPHHYGILNGQHFELHWNVLNADFISIDGIGYVNAVGKKSFFPVQHTNYKISARNRNFSTSQEIVVHVFPVPLMETIFAPIPDLSFSKIELNINPIPVIAKPDPVVFPSLQIPSPIDIQKKIAAEKPMAIILKREMIKPEIDTIQYRSFKTRLFNMMENRVQNNYKLTDIIRTIRKHYE